METRKLYGLIGRHIGHSFSRPYFLERFAKDGLEDHDYRAFDLESLDAFRQLLAEHPNLAGLNVTIPYKQEIIGYLDQLSPKAAQIGAVNCIRFKPSGQLKGYNTDAYGFKKSIQPLLQPHHKKALVLGTGGASKAVVYALDRLGITSAYVSRDLDRGLRYDLLNETTFDQFTVIVNCTPMGTHPNVSECPPIPYEFLSARHLAYDLIYNPGQTLFLQKAAAQGAQTKNGYEMLVLQAEKSWKIWHRQ